MVFCPARDFGVLIRVSRMWVLGRWCGGYRRGSCDIRVGLGSVDGTVCRLRDRTLWWHGRVTLCTVTHTFYSSKFNTHAARGYTVPLRSYTLHTTHNTDDTKHYNPNPNSPANPNQGGAQHVKSQFTESTHGSCKTQKQ